MPYPGSYVPYKWKMVCDVCGQTYLNSQMKMRWDNLMCCPFDFEVRHPQDFVRAIPDDMRADPARPPPADAFATPSVFGGYLQRIEAADVTYLLTQDGGNFIIQVANA